MGNDKFGSEAQKSLKFQLSLSIIVNCNIYISKVKG